MLDVATGRVVDGPIDRTRYSPVAWLPDGSGFYYVRRLSRRQPVRPPGLPAPARHGSGDTTNTSSVTAATRGPTSGSTSRRDGRWLVVVGAAIGTAPRDDVWIADLTDPGGFTVVQQGVDARCYASVGFDGRLYIWTDATRRGAGCASPTRRSTGRRTGRRSSPRTTEAVLGDFAVLDRRDPAGAFTPRDQRGLVVFRARPASRLRDVALPGIGSVLGLTASPTTAAPRPGSATPTRSPRRPSCDADGSLWAAAPGDGRRCPASRASWRCVRAPTAHPMRRADARAG